FTTCAVMSFSSLISPSEADNNLFYSCRCFGQGLRLFPASLRQSWMGTPSALCRFMRAICIP
ncbi:MAG: hypothetical protein EBT20_17290, partial [Alphaproteobacteria bacterium]|nr:hypothetical protein [Alphaproteobacteria bacterium]